MNLERFELDQFKVEEKEVKDVLRVLLHSIIFNRALGVITPEECESEVFDVSYVRCDSKNIREAVEQGIDKFMQAMEKKKERDGTVCLSFYTKENKTWGLIFKSEEKAVFERWIVPIQIQTDAPKTAAVREQRHLAKQQLLSDNVFKIVQNVNGKAEHIPAMKDPTAPCFSFEISNSVGQKLDESWGFIKGIVQNGPPMLFKQ